MIQIGRIIVVEINPGFMTTCLASFEYITHKFARPPFSFKFINILCRATVQKLIFLCLFCSDQDLLVRYKPFLKSSQNWLFFSKLKGIELTFGDFARNNFKFHARSVSLFPEQSTFADISSAWGLNKHTKHFRIITNCISFSR